MAKITYLGDQPTTWAGVHFEPNKPVEVTNAHILKKAPNNPFFKVGKGKADKVDDADEGDDDNEATGEDKAFAGGAKAKAAGKARNVPPSYRGKPQEERWLAGYDDEGEDA